jgi:hypothetical protein
LNVTTSVLFCQTCQQGYFLNSSNRSQCLACAPDCQSCGIAGPGKCDSCLQGYILNYNSQTCEPCAANCSSCSSAYGCDVCLVGFRPNRFCGGVSYGDSCCPCPPFCQVCDSNTGICLACITGYVFNPISKGCEVPTVTVTNSTGVIVSVVVCLTFAVVLGVLAFYRGKKVALANK